MNKSIVYLDRYAYPNEFLKNEPVPDNLGMVVVIPSYKEINIKSALQSLDNCYLPKKNVEVITVINQPVDCHWEVREINQKTYDQIKSFNKDKSNPKIWFHTIFVKDLPMKNAGVGMARKIGMDEAVRRFLKSGNSKGVIISYDADCTCKRNYLQCIEDTFYENETFGASIYFQHPLQNSTNQNLIKGIIKYELHLRYFIHALRYAGFPYAFHTIGSCMAFRTDIYQKQGGMNKRKAGEDFYFLQKIIPLGNYIEISDTRVMPSIRMSSRTPFGTGRQMKKWGYQSSNSFMTFSLDTFRDLRKVISILNSGYTKSSSDLEKLYCRLPKSFKSYMSDREFIIKLTICSNKSASIETYKQKVFTWFNGLKIIRYIHHCRDNFYPNISVTEAGSWMIKEIINEDIELVSDKDMLLFIRKFDQKNPVKLDRKGQICPVSFPR